MPTSLRAVLSDWFFWLIGPTVFVSRWLTMSQPYFGDALAIIRASQNHSYVIQPPGYWLYCRIAGLFPDPGFGLGLINPLVSALGSMVFYLVRLHPDNPVGGEMGNGRVQRDFFLRGSLIQHIAPMRGNCCFPP